MDLEGHLKLKVEHKQQKKEKKERKFIGSMKKKRGQFLFAYDNNKDLVYKVIIQEKKVFDVTKNFEKSMYKAYINPENRLVYAINLKNAKRKFHKNEKVYSLT